MRYDGYVPCITLETHRKINLTNYALFHIDHGDRATNQNVDSHLKKGTHYVISYLAWYRTLSWQNSKTLKCHNSVCIKDNHIHNIGAGQVAVSEYLSCLMVSQRTVEHATHIEGTIGPQILIYQTNSIPRASETDSRSSYVKQSTGPITNNPHNIKLSRTVIVFHNLILIKAESFARRDISIVDFVLWFDAVSVMWCGLERDEGRRRVRKQNSLTKMAENTANIMMQFTFILYQSPRRLNVKWSHLAYFTWSFVIL